MTLFAYLMTNDDGSAPNPFHDVCTLALCMPMTRGAAQPGDYVVGLAGKRLRECLNKGGEWRIIYAMQISDAMTFEDYRLHRDSRFRAKRPGKGGIKALGDNVGHAVKGTDRLLIGEKFAYWGRELMPVPPELGFLVSAFSRETRGNEPSFIGHRRKFSEDEVAVFIEWFNLQERGRLGDPTDWDERKGC